MRFRHGLGVQGVDEDTFYHIRYEDLGTWDASLLPLVSDPDPTSQIFAEALQRFALTCACELSDLSTLWRNPWEVFKDADFRTRWGFEVFTLDDGLRELDRFSPGKHIFVKELAPG